MPENKAYKIDLVLINLDRINKVGIFTLAAYAREKFLTVKIIDGSADSILEKFSKLNEEGDVLSVGFTATTDIINPVRRLAERIKKIKPETVLILGGYHGTILPEETLKESIFDIVVVREGEITLAEILLKLKEGIYPTKVIGCYEKIDSEIFFNGYRPPIEDLDSLPFPAYDLVEIKNYFHGIRENTDLKRVMVLLISRGCPFDCVFCGSKQMWCRRFRMHGVDYVVKLVKKLIDEYQIDGISFLDDELVTNHKYISELCDRFIAEGISKKIKWSCHSRVSSVNLEILNKMKRAGCILVRFGIESGSEKVLTYLKNNTTKPTQAYEAIKLCQEAGIPAFGSFIIGSPDETIDDIVETIKFIEKSGLTYAEVFSLVPYPGTDIYYLAKDKELLKPNVVWDDFKIEGENSYSILKNYHFDFNQIDQIRSYIELNVISRLNSGLSLKKLDHHQEIEKIAQGDLSKTEFSRQGKIILKINKLKMKIIKAIKNPRLAFSYLFKKIKANWPILSIVVLAFIFRVWGVAYGLSGLFIGDEKSLVGGALKMIYEKNIFPVLAPDAFRLLYYPAFIPWIYLIFFVPWLIFSYFTGDFNSFSQVKDYFTIYPESFFLIARLINVGFSAVTIFLVYLAAKKLFSKRVGLYSALIYAVSWLATEQGHFSKHWNVGGFFAFLILFFAFSILKNPSRKNYILAGLAVGLAGFSDYVYSLYGIIVIGIHFFFFSRSLKQKILDFRLWIFISLAAVIFGLGVLVYPQEFQRLFLGEDSTAAAVKNLTGFWQTVSEVIKTLFHLETVMFILALIGGLFLFFKNKKIIALLIFIPLLSPFLYYFFLHFEPRYVLLFLPFLGILAGFGLNKIIEFSRIKSKIIIALVCLAVIFWPLKNLVVFDRILIQTDSRILAKEWVEKNLPFGSKIIINSWEFNLMRNHECIYDQQQTNNLSLRSRDYVMWARSYPDSYCVWPLDLIQILPKNFKDYQYYLIDEQTARRFSYLGDGLMPYAELIKKFDGSPIGVGESSSDKFISESLKGLRPGPTVWIYQFNFNSKK